MFARYGDPRGMDHMRLHPMRTKPARQPEAVSTSFEGQCNPRDLAAGLDRLVAPAMQQAKQPFCTRLQLLARLALNAGKHTGNQPTRLAHLDDGNDCAILVQGDEGPAQVVRLGHKGTPSVSYLQRRWCHLLVPLGALGWIVVSWPGGPIRRELPCHFLCLKHLGETCAPADWPRRMPRRKLRPRAPVQGAAGVVTARAL